MTPRDVFNWEEERDTDGSVEAGHQDDGLAGPPFSQVQSAEDLVIEKKWLQLTRVDPEKFAFFFDKYHDRILAFAFWKTGDHELAAEIANSVFAVAWQKLGRFKWQRYSFGAWLFQIARGEISNSLRRLKVRNEVEFRPRLDDLTGQGFDDDQNNNSPDRIFDRKRDEQLVRLCLNQLDSVRHDVFVLHYWLGMTTAQVGTVLKMPLGTVTSHLKRGRRQLLEHLQEQGLERGLSPQGQKTLRDEAIEVLGLQVVDDEERD